MNDRDAYESAEAWWKSLLREERGKLTTDVDAEWITEAEGAKEYYFQNIVSNPASMEDAWDYWQRYSALPKRVAFKDGKLLAFMATEAMDADQAFDDAAYGSASRLAKFYPEEYGEYDKWTNTEEGQEESANFFEWLRVNYPELANDDALRENTPPEWWDRKDESHPDLDWGRGGSMRFKKNAAFEHSLDALQSIADGADYGVLHNAKYGEIRYPLGRTGDGGMGFMHIVEHRMNGGATLEEAVDTAIRVGQAAEIGEETKEEYNTRHLEFDGARAIIAIMPEQTPIITGYEIDADETATANRRAAELAPHPHVRSEEIIGALRDRISNLRSEGKGVRASRSRGSAARRTSA